ncbi:hypothetical protein ACFL48_01755 [Pseudomonadota bacterium]
MPTTSPFRPMPRCNTGCNAHVSEDTLCFSQALRLALSENSRVSGAM